MAAEGGEEAEAAALEFTPTWIVAAVCSVIVLLSLVAERFLHYLGKVRAGSLLAFLSRSISSACAAYLRLRGLCCCSFARAEAEEEEPEAAFRGAPKGQRRYYASVSISSSFAPISSICRRPEMYGVSMCYFPLAAKQRIRVSSFSFRDSCISSRMCGRIAAQKPVLLQFSLKRCEANGLVGWFDRKIPGCDCLACKSAP
jgi:hypothetical protein